ncbi:MAG: DUF1993 domain-containing protein [Betaproteobacteria bacterium]|nr:DUF1993 domain-containing protein [Betaproteobacteria bacterium]
MAITMSEISLPVFIRHLEGLSIVLKKAQAVYGEKKLDENSLLSQRMYPDMFSFARQVQAATDHARNCTALLAGVDAPQMAMNEKSIADLVARVDNTVAWLKNVKPAQVDGSEGKSVTVKAGDRELQFTGIDLLLKRALPNFYFHATTAYDMLRANGLEIGKRHFMGNP